MHGAVETARLRGEPLTDAHYEELCRLLGDPRVGATLGGTRDPEQVRERLTAHTTHWRDHGFGMWLWRKGDYLVARGGLNCIRVDGVDEVEVGWAVVPELWSQGYATELGAASLRFAFEQAALDNIIAFTLPDNAASRRVMEKLGMAYEKDIVHIELPHVLYRLRSI